MVAAHGDFALQVRGLLWRASVLHRAVKEQRRGLEWTCGCDKESALRRHYERRGDKVLFQIRIKRELGLLAWLLPFWAAADSRFPKPAVRQRAYGAAGDASGVRGDGAALGGCADLGGGIGHFCLAGAQGAVAALDPRLFTGVSGVVWVLETRVHLSRGLGAERGGGGLERRRVAVVCRGAVCVLLLRHGAAVRARLSRRCVRWARCRTFSLSGRNGCRGRSTRC